MANPELLEEQREETRLIIEELLEDGSDPDALYTRQILLLSHTAVIASTFCVKDF
jgi:regulator of RNase E activity RraB